MLVKDCPEYNNAIYWDVYVQTVKDITFDEL